MRYKWVDYTKNDMETVESWLDSEAVKYTGWDDGWSYAHPDGDAWYYAYQR